MATTGQVSSVFRARVLLPVAFAVFWSPLPKRLGLYEFILSQDPLTVGSLPASIASEADWGFTFDDLYGDGKFERSRLEGQSAIVTGANSGTGYEVSLALARLGVRVTMACRNPSKCEAAATAIREDPATTGKVSSRTVELSSLESVKKFCQGYLATHINDRGKLLPLDMLFLIAGILLKTPKEDGSPALSVDGIETVFATNIVGHHLMFKLLQPVIFHSHRTTPARIVQTSSSESFNTIFPYKVPTDLETLNSACYTGLGAYGQSKLAQILWVKELTAQLDANEKNANNRNPNQIVYANAANIGAVATNIQPSAEWGAMGSFIRSSAAKWITHSLRSIFWTAEEGALTLLYLGTAIQDLQTKQIRGQYFHPQSKHMSDHRDASDSDPNTKVLPKKLWKFLDELVKDFV